MHDYSEDKSRQIDPSSKIQIVREIAVHNVICYEMYALIKESTVPTILLDMWVGGLKATEDSRLKKAARLLWRPSLSSIYRVTISVQLITL